MSKSVELRLKKAVGATVIIGAFVLVACLFSGEQPHHVSDQRTC